MNLTIDIAHHVSEQENTKLRWPNFSLPRTLTELAPGRIAQRSYQVLLFLIIKIITSFLGEFVLSIAPKTMQEDLLFFSIKNKGKAKTGVILDTRTKGARKRRAHAIKRV